MMINTTNAVATDNEVIKSLSVAAAEIIISAAQKAIIPARMPIKNESSNQATNRDPNPANSMLTLSSEG